MSILSRLDANQIIKATYDPVTGTMKYSATGGSLVTEPFDEQDYTYVAAGNGAGEIETIVYKLSGATIATVTYTYDASDRVINSKRT